MPEPVAQTTRSRRPQAAYARSGRLPSLKGTPHGHTMLPGLESPDDPPADRCSSLPWYRFQLLSSLLVASYDPVVLARIRAYTRTRSRNLSVCSACVSSVIPQPPLPSKHNSHSRETLGSIRHISWQARNQRRWNDLSHIYPHPLFPINTAGGGDKVDSATLAETSRPYHSREYGKTQISL